MSAARETAHRLPDAFSRSVVASAKTGGALVK